MFGQQPMGGISLPPNAAVSGTPDQAQSAISDMIGGMGGPQLTGEQRSAMGYVDAAFEMLTAAADEVPQIADAIQQVKDFATQTVGMALGIAGPPQPAMPPQMGPPPSVGGPPQNMLGRWMPPGLLDKLGSGT